MENKKKVIGVVGFKSADDKSFGCGINHLEYISKFGNPKILMPWEQQADVDMVYLPGGLDINPAASGQEPGFKTSNTDVFKQFFYDFRLRLYIEAKIPVFGVCLGFQQLAVFFNCQLKQHLLFHPNSGDRWLGAHDVELTQTKKKLTVNGHHHQGIGVSKFNTEELTILATAKNTGDGVLVEAFKHKTLPVAGVQWHPEEWYDEFSGNLIRELLNTPKQ